jgi:hypothetical protein
MASKVIDLNMIVLSEICRHTNNEVHMRRLGGEHTSYE